MEATGLKKSLLEAMERVSYRVASDVLANSEGLREYVTRHIWPGAVGIIGSGSTNGIDLGYFSGMTSHERTNARRSLGLDAEAFAVLFIGRLVRDKGIVELVDAFTVFSSDYPNARLCLVGPYESGDPISPVTRRSIHENLSILEFGQVDDVRPFLAASDMLVLPSYREGLPNVLLQAAAYSLPIVATNIPGNTDIVRDRDTGILIPPKDPHALSSALSLVAANKELARDLGVRARIRVEECYDQRVLWPEIKAFYASRLQSD
ncbi:MAG TPA: glycosyltransferase [Actinobacteria bacterium]|nr:glycosyltransferase [Actinomycetota bacterium]